MKVDPRPNPELEQSHDCPSALARPEGFQDVSRRAVAWRRTRRDGRDCTRKTAHIDTAFLAMAKAPS